MRVRGDEMTEARGWSGRKKGYQPRRLLEAGKGKEIDSFLKSPKGKQSCQYLDFRFLTSRTVRE